MTNAREHKAGKREGMPSGAVVLEKVAWWPLKRGHSAEN